MTEENHAGSGSNDMVVSVAYMYAQEDKTSWLKLEFGENTGISTLLFWKVPQDLQCPQMVGTLFLHHILKRRLPIKKRTTCLGPWDPTHTLKSLAAAGA